MEEILLLPKGLGQKQDIELADFLENGGIPLKKMHGILTTGLGTLFSEKPIRGRLKTIQNFVLEG